MLSSIAGSVTIDKASCDNQFNGTPVHSAITAAIVFIDVAKQANVFHVVEQVAGLMFAIPAQPINLASFSFKSVLFSSSNVERKSNNCETSACCCSHACCISDAFAQSHLL